MPWTRPARFVYAITEGLTVTKTGIRTGIRPGNLPLQLHPALGRRLCTLPAAEAGTGSQKGNLRGAVERRDV